MSRTERLLITFQGSLLAASTVGAVAVSSTDDWDQFGLLILVGLVSAISGAIPIQVAGFKANASSIGLALLMFTHGPTPAIVVAVTTCLVTSISSRLSWKAYLVNISTYVTFALVGGLMAQGAVDAGWTQAPAAEALCVFVVFFAANAVNFALVAIDFRVVDGVPLKRCITDVYWPVIPVEIASAVLTAALVAIYSQVGVGTVVGVAAVGLVFQYLLHLTFESRQRGEQLVKRTQELASLQVGLLSTVLKTLALRDKMTARHSAAVARYSRAMAREIGLSERDQELIHTAGLLHDIGKFIFPDDILLASTRLTDEQYEIVKKHPEQGAKLVASIEGYGPVAEIILAHHEKIDGTGYPHGISGMDIPIGARIISIADTYDVMTSRDSYRSPVRTFDAIKELRRVAGSQLDAALVEVFVDLVARKVVGFRHNDEADFERELNLERKVRDYADSRAPVAA